MSDQTLLSATLAQWELAVSPHQLAQFAQLDALLHEWNTRMNLVAASTLADSIRRHVLDSLVLATAWPQPQPPHALADVGSGAGFPGLPLAILWPQTQVTLIESVTKKTRFLHHVVEQLQLNHVQVCAERVEVFAHGSQREQYDLVTARAVAHLSTLAEYCLPLCRPQGLWFAPKGLQIEAEAAEAQTAIHTLGGKLEGIYDVDVPGAPLRSLVVVTKLRPCSSRFPRAVGLAAKQPL